MKMPVRFSTAQFDTTIDQEIAALAGAAGGVLLKLSAGKSKLEFPLEIDLADVGKRITQEIAAMQEEGEITFIMRPDYIDAAASESLREAAIKQIEQHLSLCRRRLRRAELGNLLIEYLLSTSLAIAIASGLFLTLKLVFALGGLTQAGTSEWLMTGVDYAYVATLAVALMTFGIAIVVRLLHRLPSSIAAAERLDRAARDHNRVANALWLLQEDFDPDSPLCMAAIRDGVQHIERLQDSRPDTTATKRALGQYWLRFTTAGLLLLLYVVTIISPLPALWSTSANNRESAMASQGRIAGVDSSLLTAAEDETATVCLRPENGSRQRQILSTTHHR